MAGFNGREFIFDWDTTTLAGVRTRSLSVTNDYVDVTTDDSNAWRELLSDPATRSVEVSISGITTDEVLLDAIMQANIASTALSGALPTALSVPGSVAGNYLVSSYESSGDHDGAVEFSATFMSNGPITYTASSGV